MACEMEGANDIRDVDYQQPGVDPAEGCGLAGISGRSVSQGRDYAPVFDERCRGAEGGKGGGEEEGTAAASGDDVCGGARRR